MQVANDTPLPAALVPSSEPGDRIRAVAITAVTHRIDDGQLRIAPAQRPLALAAGPLPNDRMMLKTGVSVCATGWVYAPGGEARKAQAALSVGDRVHRLAVFGPRVWQESVLTGGLQPTAPLPFRRVEMIWKNAYGGSVHVPSSLLQVDGADAIVPAHPEASPYNLDGTGFYTDAKQALHHPLPQIEDPAALIRAWNDRPEPVCFAPYPVYGALRAQFILREGPSVDPTQAGLLSSRAPPRTTFATGIAPGTRISLEGMRPGGAALAFAVPPPPVEVHVSVGAERLVVVPALSAVDVDAEAAEVRLLYRAEITYGLVRFELRRVTFAPSRDFPPASRS